MKLYAVSWPSRCDCEVEEIAICYAKSKVDARELVEIEKLVEPHDHKHVQAVEFKIPSLLRKRKARIVMDIDIINLKGEWRNG